jgi:predicted dehydrogenase
MSAPLKIGVIGVGVMGERHARVLRGLPSAQLVGIQDVSEERASLVASRYGVPTFGRIDELLEKVDAVTVATPTPLHYENVKQCLQAGKHVLVEKAFTEHLAQAEELTTLAAHTGRLLQVGHIERYNPVYTSLKRYLQDSGEQPFALTFRRLSSFVTSNRAVDVVLDLMIHDLDLLLDLNRSHPMERLSAVGRIIRTSEIDHAIAHASMRGGPVCTLFASRVTEQKVRSIEVTTPSSFIQADLLRKEIVIHRNTQSAYQAQDGGIAYQQQSVIERVQVPTTEPLLLELTDFVECVRSGGAPTVSAHDALLALRATHEVIAQIQHQIPAAQPAP